MAAAGGMVDDDRDLEIVVDETDGFVYKRKKRPRSDPPSTAAVTSSDPATEHQDPTKRRRDALLRVRDKYKDEIAEWELLSNTLKGLQDKARIVERSREQPSTSTDTGNEDVGLDQIREKGLDLAYRGRVDELLLRAEADQAVIQSMSNLCDMAEAMCDAQEQRWKKEYLDLPVWLSPQEMMAALCDKPAESDNCDGSS